MRKVWTIARREYAAMVATKAFLISITLMPMLMMGSVLVASRMEKFGDPGDKIMVVADGSGGALFGDLRQRADALNEMSKKDSATAQPRYVIKRHERDLLTDDDRLALSDQVRREEIETFVEIPAGLVGEGPLDAAAVVKFYANNPMLSAQRQWVSQALNEAVVSRRVAQMGLDAAAVKQATAPTPVAALGLYKRDSEGGIHGADEENKLAGMFVPLGFMMLMFMVIMLSAQPLLESVMEEKSGRIAEVLLGSVSVFELMLGKLLGNVAGSLSVVAIYGIGGAIAAYYNGWAHLFPIEMAPWFLIYQVLSVLLFSSIFMAVGAAVTQLKEAQSALLPVWLLMAIPMMAWLPIVREPNGAVATWMSFFPPAAPLTMVLRLSSEAVIPGWQIAISLAVLIVATAGCIFLASRIFRVGILWQGKTPRMREIMRWALRG